MINHDMRDLDGLVPRCPKHPTYTGANKPRVSKVTGEICEVCNVLHAKYHYRAYRRNAVFRLY